MKSPAVQLVFPFAILGIAGGMCAAYLDGADDTLAFGACAYAWGIPALVGLLFTTRLGNVGAAAGPAWLRPLAVFLAGCGGGVAARIATGVRVDVGAATLYVVVGVLTMGALLARLRLAPQVLFWLGRSAVVTPIVLFVGSAVVGLSTPWIVLAGFALVLLAAERVGRARGGSTVDRAERRTLWLATGAALGPSAALVGRSVGPDRSGPLALAAVAAGLCVLAAVADLRALARVRKILTGSRKLLAPGEGNASALEGPWHDFGLGEQEWRFEGEGGVSFGIGDPESARSALLRLTLADAIAVVLALAALAIEAHASTR